MQKGQSVAAVTTPKRALDHFHLLRYGFDGLQQFVL